MSIEMDEYDENQMFGHSATKPHHPLSKWFRTPGVHVKLPSGGVYMPPGSIEFTMNGDLPVYPMRGADELLLKSPDALMSGYAIEELLKSCVPAIKLPRLISNPDLDVILLAIRAATYGDVMTFTQVCPSCQAENESHKNLSYLIGTMKPMDSDNSIRLSESVIVYVHPYNLVTTTRIGVATFEEARKLQALDQTEETDENRESLRIEKAKQINASLKRISVLTTEAMADCIIKIVSENNEVVDKRMIYEFLTNVSKQWTDSIQAKLDDMNQRGIDRHYEMVCANCDHHWDAEIEFNPSTFFAASS